MCRGFGPVVICGAAFGTRLSPTVAEKVGVVLVGWTKTRFRFWEWISNEAFWPLWAGKFIGHASESWVIVLSRKHKVLSV